MILAPGSLPYIRARSERDRRMFSPTELAVFGIIVLGGVLGVVGLWTGRITI